MLLQCLPQSTCQSMAKLETLSRFLENSVIICVPLIAPPKLIIDRFKWLPFPQQEQVLHPPLALGVRFWIIAQLLTRCCIQYNTRQHLHLWKLGSNTSTPTMCHHLCIKCLLPTNLLFGQTRWDKFSAYAKSSYWPVCLILVEDFLFKVTSIILITIID